MMELLWKVRQATNCWEAIAEIMKNNDTMYTHKLDSYYGKLAYCETVMNNDTEIFRLGVRKKLKFVHAD